MVTPKSGERILNVDRYLPERIRIDDRISYWKATQKPLSADIGVVEGNSAVWLFDVGSSEAARECIQSILEPKNIVLSHFHQDHITNWNRVAFQKLYQGAHTLRYTHEGEVVAGELWMEDGVCLHLFELPSSHAKGSLGLEVNERYAFLGDAIYPTEKNGRAVYNANLLAQEIKVLQGLTAEFFLLSHKEQFVYRRDEVLEQLKAIYALRDTKSAYIFVEE